MPHLSHSKDRMPVLLLEGIHDNAVRDFQRAGYHNIEVIRAAPDEAALLGLVRDVRFLGIRSRTQVTEAVLAAADRLLAIGCFCIGTNQVALDAARTRAIPVFNAPFSNTRSVAELVIGEMIMLMRGIFPKSVAAHEGRWSKSASNSAEVRGKTLGIVGYGNIGTQLGVLAEALGMRVIYHDTMARLPLGRAEPMERLTDLLAAADVVTLHVPQTPETTELIGEAELRTMRPGSFLVNASRGHVVELHALARALREGRLHGAAIDVFPEEPASASDPFHSPLRGLDNVILTPHIGGSTGEAQARIGSEVAQKLIAYSDVGATLGAVNFPEAQLPARPRGIRFMHVHHNVPGMLARVIDVFSSRGINIGAQYLQTDGVVGYVVIEVDSGDGIEDELLAGLRQIEGTIRARFLYERA